MAAFLTNVKFSVRERSHAPQPSVGESVGAGVTPSAKAASARAPSSTHAVTNRALSGRECICGMGVLARPGWLSPPVVTMRTMHLGEDF